MPDSGNRGYNRTSSTLIVIEILKLLTSILLFSLGIGLIYFRGHDLSKVVSDWVDVMWVGRPYLEAFVSRLSSIPQRTIEEIAVGSFIYSALLLIEGIGLCRQKRWAEFLTVAITASLLPFECYKLIRAPTAIALVATLINIAIVMFSDLSTQT